MVDRLRTRMGFLIKDIIKRTATGPEIFFIPDVLLLMYEQRKNPLRIQYPPARPYISPPRKTPIGHFGTKRSITTVKGLTANF